MTHPQNDHLSIAKPHEDLMSIYQAVLEQSFDGIFILDLAGNRIVGTNHQACEILHYSQSELLQQPLTDLYAHDWPKWRALVEQTRLQGAATTHELSVYSREGGKRPVKSVYGADRRRPRPHVADRPGPERL